MLAFGVMYGGIAMTVFNGHVPHWFSGQRVVGTGLIALGAVLAAWAVLYFRSWRFRAEISAGHQLATGGPFSVLRHPIYTGLNLLALGSAIWIPSPILWVAFLLMVVGSDLRGRAEEKLLVEAFGQDYIGYMKKTWRCVPGLY
jgi:protein-S-isoprenylcysteine O-methyltransferase Ste14